MRGRRARRRVRLRHRQRQSRGDRRVGDPARRARPGARADRRPRTDARRRTTPYGDLLDVTTIRQIACSAGIIPVVLGAFGEPLDVGHEERLFTGRLRTAVVLRDGECTFPDCDRPPDWCEVHHLVPWWAGGPTDLDNGALLCGRHHTIVHRDGLTGALTDGRVVWDLTPGLLHQWPRAA